MTPLQILIADDDAAMRETIVSMAVRAGHGTAPAGTGQEVLTRTAATSFDVVVLKVHLADEQGVDGFEAARRLRARPPAAPRPLLIGYATEPLPNYTERCTMAGLDAFLPHPLRQQDMQGLIDALAALATRRARGPA